MNPRGSAPPFRVHLVGCLGNGLMALARFYIGLGVEVSGCDARAEDPAAASAVRKLRDWGVEIRTDDDHVSRSDGAVVFTTAAPAGHPDLRAAARLGVPILSRVDALAELMPVVADDIVAVGGVTGKSTVAALMAQLLRQLGIRPAVYVGAEIPGLTEAPHPVDSDRFAVVEACEVYQAMNRLPRTIALVSSYFWGEHPGSYPTASSLESAFREFLSGATTAVVPARERDLAGGGPVLTFGVEPDADVRLCEFAIDKEGFTATYEVFGERRTVATTLFGRHNAVNLAAAIAGMLAAGVTAKEVWGCDFAALRAPDRRIERVAVHDGTVVYDDFGHNPMQIAAAYETLRERHPVGRLGAFLQPSGFGRIHAFRSGFAVALQLFDQVVVAPPNRSFEDADDVGDESGFADWLVGRLAERGVAAQVGSAAPDAIKHAAQGCVATCVFSILPSPVTTYLPD
jgi:UDP-N-acetylmuramate--alanine ligase